jgi:hypothetical protein
MGTLARVVLSSIGGVVGAVLSRPQQRKLAAAAVKVGAPSWSSLIFGVMRAKKRESESYLLPTACRKQKESDE